MLNYEKQKSDLEQLISSSFWQDEVQRRYKEVEHYQETFDLLCIKNHKKIYLELEVTDIMQTRQLMSWLYSESDYSKKEAKKEQLEIFGCKLQAIHYKQPIEFSEQEKQTIINLAEKFKQNG